MVQSLLTTLGQETGWAYSTMLLSPHRTDFLKHITSHKRPASCRIIPFTVMTEAAATDDVSVIFTLETHDCDGSDRTYTSHT